MGEKSQPVWREKLLEHLGDGEARTFNRIMVELADFTADTAFEKAPDHALWQLVDEELVEHTAVAPILFRMRHMSKKIHVRVDDDGNRLSSDLLGDGPARWRGFDSDELVWVGKRLGIIREFVLTDTKIERALVAFEATADANAYEQFNDLTKLRKL